MPNNGHIRCQLDRRAGGTFSKIVSLWCNTKADTAKSITNADRAKGSDITTHERNLKGTSLPTSCDWTTTKARTKRDRITGAIEETTSLGTSTCIPNQYKPMGRSMPILICQRGDGHDTNQERKKNRHIDMCKPLEGIVVRRNKIRGT